MSQPDLRPLGYGSDFCDVDGGAVLRFDDNLADVARVPNQPDGADIDLLQARLNETAARVYIVVGELLLNLTDIEAVLSQLLRVDAHLILSGDTAEAHDVYDVGYGLELLFQSPILERFQLH